VRVERTEDIAKMPPAGFEDREDHRTPFASALHRKSKLILAEFALSISATVSNAQAQLLAFAAGSNAMRSRISYTAPVS
jgi:hypothetical protein